MDKIIDVIMETFLDDFYFQDLKRWKTRLRIDDYSKEEFFRHIFKISGSSLVFCISSFLIYGYFIHI
jgi:hypothetical protein